MPVRSSQNYVHNKCTKKSKKSLPGTSRNVWQFKINTAIVLFIYGVCVCNCALSNPALHRVMVEASADAVRKGYTKTRGLFRKDREKTASILSE